MKDLKQCNYIISQTEKNQEERIKKSKKTSEKRQKLQIFLGKVNQFLSC